MKIIDLTHMIETGSPVFPGDEFPVVAHVKTLERDGFNGTRLNFSSHTGTHVDAPAHILPHTLTLDRISIDSFCGKGAVVDLKGLNKSEIDLADLQPFERLFKENEFILLCTGWSRFWGKEEYFGAYPVLTLEAAMWIHSFQLKGIGVDNPSVDKVDSTTLPIHKILLERSLIIENLTNLENLPESGFVFSCFPLKYDHADGSPIRAVAYIHP